MAPALDPVSILLVEDDPADAALLRAHLAAAPPWRFDLTHVDRLSDALAALGAPGHDVVLLDLSLPDAEGLEAFRQVRERRGDVPVLVLTALDDEPAGARAVQEGAQDYLVKGQLSARLLARALRYAIERQRLRIERARFAAAISQMSDAVLVTDGELRLVQSNRAAARLLDLPAERWRGLPLTEALRPFQLSVPLDALAAPGRALRLEIARPHTQPPLFLDARLTRLFTPSGRLDSAVLTLRDATEEREAQRLRADFFSTVSHKLRTPLFLLKSGLHLLRRSAAERQLRVLDLCQDEYARLEGVVEQLLAFKARGEAQPPAEAEPVSVGAAVAAAAEQLRTRRGGEGLLDLSVDIAPDAELAAVGAEHLGFLLFQLLDNAAKFSDKDTLRVRISAAPDGPGRLRLAVADNGPGVPPEYHDRIFEGFVQIEERPTGQVPGLGVGLALCQRVLADYGGRLSIESRLGEGSTFGFTVPAAPPPAPARAPAAADPPPGPP